MRHLVSSPEEWACGILLSSIHKSGEPHEERFELPFGDAAVSYWGQDYTPLAPLSVRITANYARDDIVTRVSLSGRFSLPCSRCLAETSIAIEGEMRYLFTLRNSGGGGAPDGDLDVIGLDRFQAELEMPPYVWETLILNLPEGVLCREDCKGLCPVCGSDRNARDCGCVADDSDPRLRILKSLL
ncbi:MAG: DUF177 domain-containing protein [Synergistaceae bacterium]|jgi:uncharacterized protein|nr:DUF177 domain-containing protein [Synergistaceae bacterium]